MVRVCSRCGIVVSEGAVCPCRTVGDGWAQANRAMCDLLHRGVVPREPLRPPPLLIPVPDQVRTEP